VFDGVRYSIIVIELQIMSDCISNMTRFHTTGACAVSYVCGDIGTPGTNVYREFYWMLRKFDKVFVVAVTECCGTTVQEALIRIDGVCSERPDVLIHMHNRSYNLDGYRILGTTLWSDREEDRIPGYREIHRRFRCIDDFTTATYRRHHETVYIG
jgi:hypothetical protein